MGTVDMAWFRWLIGFLSRRLCSRRVSMSSNHLPRLLITAARPSISGDGRKMSFLSADGRLEDRGRRDSKDSRGSIQSDVSIRLGNDGSDLSDESAAADAAGHRGRRKSWLEGYMHSASLEHSTVLETRPNRYECFLSLRYKPDVSAFVALAATKARGEQEHAHLP